MRLLREIVVVLTLLASAGSVGAEPRELTVGAVQFQVSEEIFAAEGRFAAEVSTLVAEAVSAGAELVVFPEYSGVFLATIPFAPQVARSDTVAGALRRIAEASGRPIQLRRLFSNGAPTVSVRMDRIFGALAARHGVHILAGTYFELERDEAGSPRLMNRAVLYGPSGNRVYEQDKVFLTPFERDLIGLDSGSVHEADGFSIAGVEVGLTICRDTFFGEWDRAYGDKELWIDIKADGVAYDDEAKRRYFKTIPERLEKADVPYGATVSLVGRYLDLFWEGRSSMVVWDGRTLKSLDRSDRTRRRDLVVESFVDPE
ncbi:MAG: nitrilase-related carbon-nitrogen hydrolase [Spirochaetaceae bacterium]